MDGSRGMFGQRSLKASVFQRSSPQVQVLAHPGNSKRLSHCGQNLLQNRPRRERCRHRTTQPSLERPLNADRLKSQRVSANQGYGGDDMEAKQKNREPPTLFMRVLAAVFYIVPWMDIAMIGGEFHHRFPSSVILHLIPGPFLGIYYSSQFAPLIIFFLLFLSVVKNFKLHHFTRFHCMQAIVLDIVTMLFTLVRQYFPAEIRWSFVMSLYDMFSYNICMCTILYCVFFALAGHYADIPYVSESTYLQVEEG